MKIDSLYIEAFGGIKKLKLDFGDGMNVILGANEDGKTTVMSFIKMMFYGNKGSSADIAKNIRKKYLPWDGTRAAGSIDFTHKGRKYRLEREFRGGNSTDKVSLLDIGMGERKTVAADVGTEFFGISAAAFERSVFIGQFGFPESDAAAEGEINSKLSNMALTGEESVSFETVNSRIKGAKEKLTTARKVGEYDKNIKQLDLLSERLTNSVAAAKALAEKKAFADEKKSEIERLSKRAEELRAQLSLENDIRNAPKLCDLLARKSELDALSQELVLNDGTPFDEIYVGKLKFCISKTESAKLKLETKQSEIETLEKSISAGLNPPEDATEETAELLKNEIAQLEQSETAKKLAAAENELTELKSEQAKPKTGAADAFIITGVLLTVLSAVLALTVNIFIGAGAAVGLIIAGIGFAKRLTAAKKYENAGRVISLIESNIAELKKLADTEKDALYQKKIKLETTVAALNTTAAVIENQRKMLEEKKTELAALQQEYNTECETLFTHFGKYKSVGTFDEITAQMPTILEKAEKQKEIKKEIAYLLKDLGGISYADAEKKLTSLPQGETLSSEDFEKMKAEYEEIGKKIAEISASGAAAAAEAETMLKTTENPEALKQEIARLTALTAEQKDFISACDIAMSVLADSFAEVRSTYGSQLEKSATDIFLKLTGGKYDSVNISKAFEIDVAESGSFGSHEIAYLSSGATDQAYLSLRLALSKLISADNENLPIMLDDSLAQYDDGRAKTALEFLRDYSAASQIMLFTCHGNIAAEAKTLGANVYPLKA